MKLKKRGKVWWVDYRAGGKRYRQSTGTGNKELAQEWVDRLNIARKMPTFEDAVDVLKILYGQESRGKLPVSAIWEIYSGLAKATGKDAIAERTMERRKNQVRRFTEWLKKSRPTVKTIEAVTGPVAIDFARALADMKLKTKTRANALGELGTVWKLLEKASDGVKNPWGALMPRDVDGERGKALDNDQVEAVMAAARAVGKDWHPICTIALHTGLRYGDVAQLRWDEVHEDAIRLTPSKTKRHRIAVSIPIIAPVRAALDGLVRRDDYLFPLHADLYGQRGQSSRVLPFSEVLKAAGLEGKGFTFHSLRHTAATRLAGAGVGIETRKRILGHTEDATAERYDHDEHLGELKAAMEAAAK